MNISILFGTNSQANYNKLLLLLLMITIIKCYHTCSFVSLFPGNTTIITLTFSNNIFKLYWCKNGLLTKISTFCSFLRIANICFLRLNKFPCLFVFLFFFTTQTRWHIDFPCTGWYNSSLWSNFGHNFRLFFLFWTKTKNVTFSDILLQNISLNP